MWLRALAGRWVSAERDRFVLWVPVCMGAGDLLYFAGRHEPPWWAGAAVVLAAVAGVVVARPWPVVRATFVAVLALGLGFLAAQSAAWRAPPLAQLPRRAAIVTGVVAQVEQLPSGRRVMIAAPSLDGGAALLRSVRIRLRATDTAPLGPGDVVRVRALLRPPPPPAYPGAWDLQRDCYFDGIGGYGYALGGAERLQAGHGWRARLRAVRADIAARVQAAVPGTPGRIAATLLTGFTAAIPAEDRAAFRDSGLAHLLAIAGLHIGVVMALIFGVVRRLLALSEHAALRWPCKQIASVASLAAGAGYALLTGMHVPILRSFAMAALVTLGVIAGRRVLSLRGLALAAVALIFAEPEQVTGVSFQMSFAAVLALISGYEALRPWLARLRRRRVASHLVALALTSLLAGSASAPFAAYHFGHVQLYFVLANMLAVPLAAFWVMPAGLLALAAMPLGLAPIFLVPMSWGVQAILWIGRSVSAWPSATIAVPHTPAWGLCLVALGMAWMGLWRGRKRWLGVAPLCCGLLAALFVRPPDLLVSTDARLIGLRTPAGMFVHARSGAGKFTLESWEQFWAESAAQPLDHAPEANVVCTDAGCLMRAVPRGPAALLLLGEQSLPCAQASVVVSPEPARGRCAARPTIDRFTVWREGAQAIWLRPDGARVVSDRGERGDRPWVQPVPSGRTHSSLPAALTE